MTAAAAVATVERRSNPAQEVRVQVDQMGPQFQAALPAHIPVERFKRVVMTAIQNTPELLDCDRRSLFNAAMRAAQDGLLPDGREGAMVVRRDNRSPTGKAANWQPMIAGIRKKARNSGEIAAWDAHIVCAGDHFQFQLGDNPQVNHTYDLKTERGAIIGAYSVCILKDGTKSYEVMSIAEIHKIRDRSDGWKAFKAGKIKSTPWSSDEGEMCRKTVARRHSKALPLSSDLDDLIRRDDDLYDMNGAREEAKAEAPRPKLAAMLDTLAERPAPAAQIAQADPQSEAGEEDQRPAEEIAEQTADNVDLTVDPEETEGAPRDDRDIVLDDLREVALAGNEKRLTFAIGKLTVQERALITDEDVASLKAACAAAAKGA